jgi:hypothetical protein
MPDATGGGGVIPQIIASTGAAAAAVIGALVLWPTRRRRERAAAALAEDPEDRPSRLRERLTRVETRVDNHDSVLEHQGEEIALLRAQEITTEGLTPRPRRRRAARDDD